MVNFLFSGAVALYQGSWSYTIVFKAPTFSNSVSSVNTTSAIIYVISSDTDSFVVDGNAISNQNFKISNALGSCNLILFSYVDPSLKLQVRFLYTLY